MKEDLQIIMDRKEDVIEKTIELLLYVMKSQLLLDGNKRTAVLLTSPELEEKLWSRLMTISVEDIGLGNPMAAVIVQSLNEIRKQFDYQAVDRPLFFVHAIRVLCSSKKDRSSDVLKNIVMKRIEMKDFEEIPDFALDMHTRRGQEMGKDVQHFLNEASKVIPEAEIENDYKERLIELLRKSQ